MSTKRSFAIKSSTILLIFRREKVVRKKIYIYHFAQNLKIIYRAEYFGTLPVFESTIVPLQTTYRTL